MESPHPAPLTPEQLAAINAGDGCARCEDPASHVVYLLIKQGEPSAVDDDYIREKLAEAQADIDSGNVADWNVEEVRRKLRERLASKPSRQ